MREFFEQPEGRRQARQLAAACGSSFAYFSQIAHGHRLPSHRLARLIEQKSEGAITVHDLRPDIYPESAPAATAQDAA